MVFFQIGVELYGVGAGHTLVGVGVGVELIFFHMELELVFFNSDFELQFPTPVSFVNFVREENERKTKV